MKLRYEKKLCSYILSNILVGKRVSYDSAERFAKVFDVPLDKIFTITTEMVDYSPVTKHHKKAVVRSVLSFAKKQMIVSENYALADYVTYTPVPESEVNCMSDVEIAKVFKALKNYPEIKVATLVMTLIMTSFRKGEVCGLKWHNFNEFRKTLSVEKTVTTVKGYGKVYKEPKTKSSRRTISIPQILVEQLIKYRDWYRQQALELGDRWENSEFIFSSSTGEMIHPSMITAYLERFMKYANLGHWTVHSMRHASITLQLMFLPLKIVSSRAGHSRVDTTTEIYAHALESYEQSAATVLDSIYDDLLLNDKLKTNVIKMPISANS